MNNKYHITSDGSIFEMQPDGSLKKLGSVADGQLNPYSDTNKTSNKKQINQNFSVFKKPYPKCPK